MRSRLSRWERKGLNWIGKEREILRRGRRRRPRESYGEIYLKLLRQRPQRLNEHGQPVSHTLKAVYQEAQRLGLTRKQKNPWENNNLQV